MFFEIVYKYRDGQIRVQKVGDSKVGDKAMLVTLWWWHYGFKMMVAELLCWWPEATKDVQIYIQSWLFKFEKSVIDIPNLSPEISSRTSVTNNVATSQTRNSGVSVVHDVKSDESEMSVIHFSLHFQAT